MKSLADSTEHHLEGVLKESEPIPPGWRGEYSD